MKPLSVEMACLLVFRTRYKQCDYDSWQIFFSLQLDRTVSLEQYGFVVAADALGQLIFSPIFGLIADRLDSIRLVSLICCLTFCLGNTLYANVALVPADLLGKPLKR